MKTLNNQTHFFHLKTIMQRLLEVNNILNKHHFAGPQISLEM